jgi:hypothetical protein
MYYRDWLAEIAPISPTAEPPENRVRPLGFREERQPVDSSVFPNPVARPIAIDPFVACESERGRLLRSEITREAQMGRRSHTERFANGDESSEGGYFAGSGIVAGTILLMPRP